jgi:hypothetical protein
MTFGNVVAGKLDTSIEQSAYFHAGDGTRLTLYFDAHYES